MPSAGKKIKILFGGFCEEVFFANHLLFFKKRCFKKSLKNGKTGSSGQPSIRFFPPSKVDKLVAPEGGFVATGRALASLTAWTVVPTALSAAALAYGRRLDAFLEGIRASRRG